MGRVGVDDAGFKQIFNWRITLRFAVLGPPRGTLISISSAQGGKVIYTTNAIESVNMSLRKLTKNRCAFPSDESLMKLFGNPPAN